MLDAAIGDRMQLTVGDGWVRGWRKITALIAAGAILMTACSSSSKTGSSAARSAGSSSNVGSSGSSPTVTVGVLADLTGAGSVTGIRTEDGIKAGIGMAKQDGYNIKYVMADTTTTPAGALAGAQKLVEQDHVFAVILISLTAFGAASYLTSHGVPVIGANIDGPEWIKSPNMFSIFGYSDYSKVNTTYGDIFKALGGTVFGGVAYGSQPASNDVVKAAAQAAQLAGLKVGYMNTTIGLTDTNMAPTAIAMKNAHVDTIYPGVATATSFALIQALENLGLHAGDGGFKVLLPAGYGGDLSGGGAGASQAAQNAYFTTVYEPAEMQTAATERLAAALKTYAGWNGDPTEDQYFGYLSIDALVQGLKAASENASPAQFMTAMLGIHDYAAQGLAGGHTISFAFEGRGTVTGYGNCTWVVQYQGTSFHLINGLDPVCGTTLASGAS